MGKKKQDNFYADIDVDAIRMEANGIVKPIKKGFLYTAAGVVGTAVAFATGTLFEGAYGEGKFTIKELVDPTPIKVKTGLFKSKVMRYNPITNSWSSYTGTKKPVNKRAIKL